MEARWYVSMITFEPVTKDHAEFLYEICKERAEENSVNISFSLPTFEDHLAFVSRNPYHVWYIVKVDAFAVTDDTGEWKNYVDDSYPIGYVSITDRNEIGIVLLKKYRGKGYGTQAIRKLITMHQPLPAISSVRKGVFIANINPKNVASMRLFEKLGFKHIQNTCELAHESVSV